MATDELVSVVLALYNGEKFLNEQLESILGQTYRHLEILILDDASTDGSIKIARRFAEKDHRIRIVENPQNLGLILNFLNGVSLAKGAYVCYSDQDDVWQPDKVETLLSLLRKKTSYMLAYSDLEVCDENMKTINASFWKVNQVSPYEGWLRERALLKNIAPGCSMLFRGEVKEIASFLSTDENFLCLNHAQILDDTPVMHDHLIWVLASGLGEIVFTPKKLVRYRQHSQNSIGAFYEAQRGRVGFVQRLEKRMRALKSVENKLPGIRWAAMRRFLEDYRKTARPPMPEKISYFVWMRNRSLLDYFLAALDCLMPSFYQNIQKHFLIKNHQKRA